MSQRKAYVKKSIKIFIEENSMIFTDYSNWYVGITSKPDQRHREHGSPDIWAYWEVNSHHHARDLERQFLDVGMSGDVGGGKYPRYIYVYKHSGPGS